jgi:D-alanyl-D-alanine carboxypeptidase (penicillin-binding protein 5/6)
VWAVILAVLAALAGAAALAHRRLYAAPPPATVALSVDPAGPVVAPAAEAAAAAPLPWPATGQGAVAIPAVGYSAQSGAEQPVPVASMTKIMTGYLILRDHPLAPGADGPPITITPADVAYYDQDTVTDQANVPLQAGEVLTERQMLEGLLIHSANDFADTLGAWDAGSVDAFVAKMNLTASQLGMTQTHYVDPSGYDPQSQSTASNLLKVAALALQNPTFASIVTMSSVSLPLGGVEGSYTPLLPGEPGGNPAVVGVKSGFTSAAGGGDVLALQQSVGGHQVLVLAAVTGQETADVLTSAGLAAFAIAQAAGARMVATPTLPIGTVVGTAQVLGTRVPAVTTGSGSLVAWPGDRVRQSATALAHPMAGAPAGTPLGYVSYSIGTQRLAVLVRTTSALPVPSVTQRLF